MGRWSTLPSRFVFFCGRGAELNCFTRCHIAATVAVRSQFPAAKVPHAAMANTKTNLQLHGACTYARNARKATRWLQVSNASAKYSPPPSNLAKVGTPTKQQCVSSWPRSSSSPLRTR